MVFLRKSDFPDFRCERKQVLDADNVFADRDSLGHFVLQYTGEGTNLPDFRSRSEKSEGLRRILFHHLLSHPYHRK